MHSSHEGPELARVESRRSPLSFRDPETICQELELPRQELYLLHAEGYLSFDPAYTTVLDEACEAELRFLGSIIAAGCPRAMLKVLLRDLDKPYCYDVRRMFYDWRAGCWRLLPGEDSPEKAFFSFLDRLKARNARDELLAIRTWLDEALDLEESTMLMFNHSGFRARPLPGDSRPLRSDEPDPTD